MPELPHITRPDEPTESLLTKKEQAFLVYIKGNIKRPEFAVARRQGFGRVLAMLDKLVAALKQQALQHQYQNYIISGMRLASLGQLTVEQIENSPMLNEAQRVDMVRVALNYQDAEYFRKQSTTEQA